jgi:hypothetical protein
MQNAKSISSARRFWMRIAIVAVAAAVIGINPLKCRAQVGGGGGFGVPASKQINNPPISPYLNLTQPGLNPAITYESLVRPELQLRNTLANQQQLLGDLQQRGMSQPPALLQSPTVLQTGHTTSFLDTGTYFFPLTRGQQQSKGK